MLTSSSVIIPLFYDQSIRIYRKNIRNMQHDALNSLNLKYAEK
jgi:alpha-N-acetylglucosamine transferase